jgi:Ca2+-binding EF-hand superfamily protein
MVTPMTVLRSIFPWLLALSIAASTSAQQNSLAKPLRKFDRNGDGRLEGDELRLARQAHNRGGRPAEPNPGRWRDMLERLEREFLRRREKDFDADANGQLSDGERQQARTIWRKIAGEITMLREDITARYDRNDDGELNDAERTASRSESEQRRREIEDRIVAAWRHSPGRP